MELQQIFPYNRTKYEHILNSFIKKYGEVMLFRFGMDIAAIPTGNVPNRNKLKSFIRSRKEIFENIESIYIADYIQLPIIIFFRNDTDVVAWYRLDSRDRNIVNDITTIPKKKPEGVVRKPVGYVKKVNNFFFMYVEHVGRYNIDDYYFIPDFEGEYKFYDKSREIRMPNMYYSYGKLYAQPVIEDRKLKFKFVQEIPKRIEIKNKEIEI